MTNSKALALERAMSTYAPYGQKRHKPSDKEVIEWAKLRASRAYEPRPMESLYEDFKGKGIGGTKELLTQHNQNVFSAIANGLFRLVSYRDYCGFPRGIEEFVTLELTEKGMRFFDAVPQLEEVWA